MLRRIVLVSSAVAAVAAAIALPTAAPAAPTSTGLPECPPEAPPLRGTCAFHLDEHFTSSDDCGFPLKIDVVGQIVYTPRRDKQGNLIGEMFRPNLFVTLTNPANGRAIEDRDVGLDKAAIAPDGSVRVLSTGIHAKSRTDDKRTLFRQIGLRIITFDAATGIESVDIVGGNFQPDSDFEKLVCGYLAGK